MARIPGFLPDSSDFVSGHSMLVSGFRFQVSENRKIESKT